MTEVLDLEQMPPTGPMYLKAVTPTARPSVTAGVPQRVLRVADYRSPLDKLAAYNDVCGFGLSNELPATWLHVLTFPLQLQLMTSADFPLAPVGMVHASNVMTQHRPALIGEALDLTVRADNVRSHRRGVMVDFVGQVKVGDELVWEGRSSYLNRSERLPGEIPAEAEKSRPTDLVQAGTWRLPADLGRRYAAVSGDINPIHLSALSAKALGFPRAIAHGMWGHARVLGALANRIPSAFTATAEFSKPVLLPSSVRFAVGQRPDGYVAQLTNTAADKVYLTVGISSA